MLKRFLLIWIVFVLTLTVMAKDYKAVPGMDTGSLQALIDKVSSNGGGRIIFGQGKYVVGQLVLKSGVELHLEEDALLLGSTSPYDYLPVNASQMADNRSKDYSHRGLIVAMNAKGIAITGKGIVDGQGLALALAIDSLHHTGELIDSNYNERRQRPSELVRPTLLNIIGCEDVRIEGVQLRNSAGWGLSFNRCCKVVVRHVDIYNRAYWNNDGIDLTDCHDVTVTGCRVNSADDGICLKSYKTDSGNEDITISDCEIRSSASAVKFGSASYGAFRRIHIHHIRVFDTFRSALAIESVDGATIEDVVADSITAVNTGNALFIRLGQRSGNRKGAVRRIHVSNLFVQVPFGRPDIDYDLRGPEVDYFHNIHPAPICGIPGNCIEDVLLENIRIVYPGRASKGMAYIPLWRKADVPEQIDKYPEFTMFGELPSWGFYLRHVRGVTLKNVQLSLEAEDFRPAIVEEDVEGLVMENCQTD